MGDEWKIDLKIPDIGTMMTLLATAICSAIMSAAEIAYTMMWITSAYERDGKDFFLDLLNAQALTWTAEYVLIAGSLLLISSLFFMLAMLVSLRGLKNLTKEGEQNAHTTFIFVLFATGMLLLFLTLISAVVLRYV